MLQILYVEDRKEECEPFIQLLHLAGAARLIDVLVGCVQSLDDVGAGPLCDVILLDLELGRGIAHTVGWIAANFERMPPIIVVTNHVGYEAECLRAGAQLYWHKPDIILAPQIFIDTANQISIRRRARLPI